MPPVYQETTTKKEEKVMDEVLNGLDYIMFIDTTTPIDSAPVAYIPVMCETTSSFSGTTDAQEISNKCIAGGFGNSNPGTKTWEFTGEGHAIDESGSPSRASFETIRDLWKSGQKFWARQANKDPLTGFVTMVEGVVWVSAYEQTVGTEDPFTFTYTFTGVGEPNFDEAT